MGKHGKIIALCLVTGGCDQSLQQSWVSKNSPVSSWETRIAYECPLKILKLSQLQAPHFTALEREIPWQNPTPASCVRITLKRVHNSRLSCRTEGQIIKDWCEFAEQFHCIGPQDTRSDWCHNWSVPNSFCSGSLAVRLEDGVVQLTEPLLPWSV